LLEEIRLKRKEAPDDPEYSESGLNGMGYALLSLGYQDAAIGVFLLNVEFNPQSANCSDSLAEAYERMGDRTNAPEVLPPGDRSLEPVLRKEQGLRALSGGRPRENPQAPKRAK
jgi:tetratricopeptide (TPR) repeat protein